MNDDTFLRQIERYYTARKAPPETVAFLVELARRGPSRVKEPRLAWWIGVAAIAAVITGWIGYRIGEHAAELRSNQIVIAELAPGRSKAESQSGELVRDAPKAQPTPVSAQRTTVVAESPPVDSTGVSRVNDAEREKYRGKPVVATIPPVEGEDLPRPSVTPLPRLVLARVYAEWCPRTPRLIPVYESLAQEFANEPILIVTFDVTDAGKRRQSGYLAHSLGVLGLLGHKWEPSTILLIDRESCEILETIREVDEQPRMEHALAMALPPG